MPVSFDGEPDDAEDPILHRAQGGAQLVTQLGIERRTGTVCMPGESMAAKNDRGEPTCFLEKDLIWGSRDLHFSQPGETTPGKVLRLRLLNNGRDEYLCGFTDLDSLRAVFGSKVRAALYSYEELISFLSGPLADGRTPAGLVINASVNELLLQPEDVEQTVKEKNEQPKVFRTDKG